MYAEEKLSNVHMYGPKIIVLLYYIHDWQTMIVCLQFAPTYIHKPITICISVYDTQITFAPTFKE